MKTDIPFFVTNAIKTNFLSFQSTLNSLIVNYFKLVKYVKDRDGFNKNSIIKPPPNIKIAPFAKKLCINVKQKCNVQIVLLLVLNGKLNEFIIFPF